MSETTVRWRLKGWGDSGYRSRRVAEDEATAVGTTVQRITTTVEDVGLHWRQLSYAWQLWDGPRARRVSAHIATDYPAEDGYMVIGVGYIDGVPQTYPTIEEAKAAAVEAVMAGWT